MEKDDVMNLVALGFLIGNPELLRQLKQNNPQKYNSMFPTDLSLSFSDRRVIIVIADNGLPKLLGKAHYTISKAKELFKFPANQFPANHPILIPLTRWRKCIQILTSR